MRKFETSVLEMTTSPLRMQLFVEDSDFDGMDCCNVFTPIKNTQNDGLFGTGGVRKALSDLFLDEDSGIGMENDNDYSIKFFDNVIKSDTAAICGTLGVQIRRPFASLSDTPTSGAFYTSRKLKRPLNNDFDCDSAVKRLRQSDNMVSRRRPASKLRKTLSYGDEPRKHDVQAVVDRLAEEEDLVSDGSGSYRLPTITGKHRDLKNISNTTVKDLIEGKYHDTISNYKIIDCRYPYEYEGGHVQGAENIYTREAMAEFLHKNGTNTNTILIFYCEFSSERGPKMCRYLREKDRELNSENYPALNYPEIYLMYGGYKDLFQNHKEVCEPMEYKPMLHADHADDLRYFRAKTKSGSVAEKKRKGSRLRF